MATHHKQYVNPITTESDTVVGLVLSEYKKQVVFYHKKRVFYNKKIK